MPVQFRVKIGEKVYDLVATDEDTTIFHLKGKLSNVASINAVEQQWIFQGRILADSATFNSSGISEGSCVIVVKSASAATAVSSVSSATTLSPQVTDRPTPPNTTVF